MIIKTERGAFLALLFKVKNTRVKQYDSGGMVRATAEEGACRGAIPYLPLQSNLRQFPDEAC